MDFATASDLLLDGAIAGAVGFLAVYAGIVVRALWSVVKPPKPTH